MNWVGGSRNRLMMKNDAKKQREFFEKKRVQQKMKNMGIALPTSPRGTSCTSMDLVTLFVVNQIAAKKEHKDPPKVAVLGSCKSGSKYKRNEPLVLPMSPGSPSQLSLMESQSQCSVQGTRKRKYVIPQKFKCRQLSPVLESGFSDNSASDYLPRLSPFSTPSASSGHGVFPLQLNLGQRDETQAEPPPHWSPPAWDTSGLEQTQFQPFSQPRATSWSRGSNPTFYRPDTPTIQSPLVSRDNARQEVTFSFHQAGDQEPMFTLNQSESEQQFEEDVFRGFSNEEYDGEASYFGGATSKIYLKEQSAVKSSTPQTVPDSQYTGVELSNCTDTNFSCFEQDNSSVDSYEYPPSYSCRGCYLTSDSNDYEECCQPVDQTHFAHTENANLQGNRTQSPSTPRSLMSQINPLNATRDDHKVIETDLRSNGTNQFVSPPLRHQAPHSEQCKCKKTPNQMQDAGTQTIAASTAETCDASTQCGVLSDYVSEATGFNLYQPPVGVSVQHSATWRQSDAAESNTHTAPSANATSEWKHTPWRKMKSKAAGGKVSLQRPINPFLGVLSMADGGDKQDGAGRDERGQEDNGPLMKDLSGEVRDAVTSATTVNRLLDEAETLKEIADILLLLKQRTK